jgi:hypothetical protein
MRDWYIGLDSMVYVEEVDDVLTEEEAIKEAYWKIRRLLEEAEGNILHLLEWNVESEEVT